MKDPLDWEPKEAFSNSTNFLYYEAFMQGLNLQLQVNSAEKCQNNLIYFSDEFTLFENNFTYTFEFTPLDEIQPFLPMISGLYVVGGNFSQAWPNCYKSVQELYDYYYSLYQAMGGDTQNFFLSFLFTQMTYAISYKKAFDRMEENEVSQNYLDNMT